MACPALVLLSDRAGRGGRADRSVRHPHRRRAGPTGSRTFGYFVLRSFFDQQLVDALRAEVIGTIQAVHGDRYHEHPPMSGMAGHYTCLLGPWAPRTVELVDSPRLVRLAERLVGGWALPSPCDTQGILYFDHAPWHNDSGIAIRGAKFVAYLDRSTPAAVRSACCQPATG